MPVYAEHMRKLLKEGISHPEHYDRPLEGFHFLVDAGNGGGGFFATDVLAPLGADITGMLWHAWQAMLLHPAPSRSLSTLWVYQTMKVTMNLNKPANVACGSFLACLSDDCGSFPSK